MKAKIVTPFLIAFLLLFPSGLLAKTIFVIDSYHASFTWTKNCRQGFNEHINPGYQVSYFEMDTKRIHSDLFAERAEEIWQKIVTSSPDLVVTMDDNALKFLGQRISDAGFPLVFMGVNHNPRSYFADGKVPPSVTGILEQPLLAQNVAVISEILPVKERRILLMTDDGVTSRSYIDLVLKGNKTIDVDGTTVDIIQLSQYSAWQERIKALSPDNYDALMIGSYAGIKDKAGQSVSAKEISEWTSLNSAIPMFTFWFHDAGKGKAVGGLVISGQDQGATAAHAANTILETGEVPKLMSPRHGQFIFSKSELSRWGIELPDYIKRRSILIE